VISNEAKQLRDLERSRLEALPKAELARIYDGRMDRRLEPTANGVLEVVVGGSWDVRDPDRTSTFLVWVYVRPRWVSGIPFLRWWLSARAWLVTD